MESQSKMVKKKKIAVVIVVFLIFAGVLGIISALIPEEEPNETIDYRYRYSDNPLGYPETEPDTTIDIMTYAPYLLCDRSFHYSVANETVGYTFEQASTLSGDIVFFVKYFTAIMNGDAETLLSMFSDEEYRTEFLPQAFSCQMVYNMYVEYFGSEDNVYYYGVRYSILENDGTFRNDIDDEAYRTLYFELIPDGFSYKIQTIYTSPLGFDISEEE